MIIRLTLEWGWTNALPQLTKNEGHLNQSRLTKRLNLVYSQDHNPQLCSLFFHQAPKIINSLLKNTFLKRPHMNTYKKRVPGLSLARLDILTPQIWWVPQPGSESCTRHPCCRQIEVCLCRASIFNPGPRLARKFCLQKIQGFKLTQWHLWSSNSLQYIWLPFFL